MSLMMKSFTWKQPFAASCHWV